MPVSPTYAPAPRITTLGEGYYDEVTAARFPQRWRSVWRNAFCCRV